MRNRFLVALLFLIPVVPYSPMGKCPATSQRLFGMDRKLLLFLTGTAAIIYPAWTSSWRPDGPPGNGVLNMAVLVVLRVGTGYAFSVAATFFFEGDVFYEASG